MKFSKIIKSCKSFKSINVCIRKKYLVYFDTFYENFHRRKNVFSFSVQLSCLLKNQFLKKCFPEYILVQVILLSGKNFVNFLLNCYLFSLHRLTIFEIWKLKCRILINLIKNEKLDLKRSEYILKFLSIGLKPEQSKGPEELRRQTFHEKVESDRDSQKSSFHELSSRTFC